MYDELTVEDRVLLAIEYISRNITIPSKLADSIPTEVLDDLGVDNVRTNESSSSGN